MQADRIQGTPLFQHSQAGATAGKKILGVDFQKVQRRLLLQQLRVMRVPPPDTGLNVAGQRRGMWCLHERLCVGADLEMQSMWNYILGAIRLPFIFSQVPLATYFHSPLSMSTLDWPAHEWVPEAFAQSF
mgnify:CR=1 FL=1